MTECPKCLGAEEVVYHTPEKKWHVKDKCDVCKGTGSVPNTLAEDYIHANTLYNDYIDEYIN